MTLIASDIARISNWLKFEFEPELKICRKTVTVNEASAITYNTGLVLQRTLVSGAATAAALAGNAGNGTMGTVTVLPTARVGRYMLNVVATASNAGVFKVSAPDGSLVGYGNVATAFLGGGLSFTLADGSTDFSVADGFTIDIAGTEKYSAIAQTGDISSAVIYVSDVLGNTSQAIAATTDTTVVVMWRGTALVADGGLTYGATTDTAAEQSAVLSVLEGKGILVAPQL